MNGRASQVTAVTTGYIEVTSKLLYAQAASYACITNNEFTPGYRDYGCYHWLHRGYIKVAVCTSSIIIMHASPVTEVTTGYVEVTSKLLYVKEQV